MACFVRSQNLDPGDVYKRAHSIVDTLLAYSATLTSEPNRDLRYDVFDVYFLSATSSTPSRRPSV